MSVWLRAGGITLLGMLISVPHSYAADPLPSVQQEIEPPPTEVEPPPTEIEPPPAPLREELSVSPKSAETDSLSRTLRRYDAGGYTGVALTVGLVTSGIVLGVLSQQRSDELSVLTTQRENGLPPVYDQSQRENYERLQSEGQQFNRATIGCLVVSGVTALGTGVLFWARSRAESAGKKLSLLPTLSGTQAGLMVVGRW